MRRLDLWGLGAWRLDVRPYVGAVISGVLSGVLGLRTPDAVLFGLVALVIGLVLVSGDAGAQNEWPDGEYEETDGTRREVAAITWSLVGREGRVAEPAVRRLRTVAVRRLARHGVDLPHGLGPRPTDEDEAELRAHALLGDRAWTILTAPGGRLPSLNDVEHCVDVIERLGTDPLVERPLP